MSILVLTVYRTHESTVQNDFAISSIEKTDRRRHSTCEFDEKTVISAISTNNIFAYCSICLFVHSQFELESELHSQLCYWRGCVDDGADLLFPNNFLYVHKRIA